MKELIAKIAVETIRPNRWILGFNGHKSNPQFGLPPGWTSPPSCRLISDQEEAQQRNCNTCGVCEFLLGDIEDSPSKKSKQIGIPPSNISPSKISFLSHISPSCNVCEFLLGDIEDSPSKKSKQIGIPPSNISPSKISFLSHISPSCNVCEFLLGDIEDSPSKKSKQIGIPPSNISPSKISFLSHISPSCNVCEFLLGDIEDSPSKKSKQIGIPPSNISPSKISFLSHISPSCNVCEFLLGDIEDSPSKKSKQIGIPPSNISPSKTSSRSHISPSKDSPSKKHRNWGEGNGTIHWRTITKNGKDYPQAYYHWKENARKRTKYIPKQLLGVIQEAEEQKRPVIEILGLLGVVPNDSNEELLVGIENSPSTDDEQWLPTSKNSPSNDGEQLSAPTSKNSPSKTRRDKGLGTGGIQWKTITLNGKDYPQAWYHYEFWQDGDRLVKKSKYIPKRLLTRIQELEAEKTPVKEILKLLRVKL